jgi:hypothetical protein
MRERLDAIVERIAEASHRLHRELLELEQRGRHPPIPERTGTSQTPARGGWQSEEPTLFLGFFAIGGRGFWGQRGELLEHNKPGARVHHKPETRTGSRSPRRWG